MRVGIHLPQLGRSASLDHIVDVARRAEAAGFDDVWTADHVAVPTTLEGMPGFFPEPVPVLSAAAAHTSRVGLGVSVLIPAYRNPTHFAKQWATLDWLSGGRTILGVGAGWLEPEFEACGVPMVDRARRLDDYIGGWRAAWSGETSYESDHFSFHDVKIKPAPAGRAPIWIGGTSKGALRRAATIGDGWIGTLAPPQVFAERLEALRGLMDEVGRDRAEVTISLHMEVRIGEPVGEGSRWSEVGDGYGDRAMITGDAEEIADRVRDYVAHGLEHVELVPIAATRDEWSEHIDVLAQTRRLLEES